MFPSKVHSRMVFLWRCSGWITSTCQVKGQGRSCQNRKCRVGETAGSIDCRALNYHISDSESCGFDCLELPNNKVTSFWVLYKSSGPVYIAGSFQTCRHCRHVLIFFSMDGMWHACSINCRVWHTVVYSRRTHKRISLCNGKKTVFRYCWNFQYQKIMLTYTSHTQGPKSEILSQ